jgi:hypothetical protein
MSKYQRSNGVNLLNLSTKLVNQAGMSIHSNTFMSSAVIKAKNSGGMMGLKTSGCEGIEGSVVMNSAAKHASQILCRGKAREGR